MYKNITKNTKHIAEIKMFRAPGRLSARFHSLKKLRLTFIFTIRTTDVPLFTSYRVKACD